MSAVSMKLCRSSKCGFACARIKCASDFKQFPPSLNHVKRNVRCMASIAQKNEPPIIPQHCDVLIIGGGIVGSSISYWLKQRTHNNLSVVVVEKDPAYTIASTVRSCGGIRQQYTVPENIQMSMFGGEFLQNIKKYLAVPGADIPDVQFNLCGYLFLATESKASLLEESHKLQRSLGAKVELLSKEKLKEMYPWMNLDDIVLASRGTANEGWVDPWSYLYAFKNAAVALGTTYVKADAVAFEFPTSQDGPKDSVPKGVPNKLDKLLVKTNDGETHSISFDKVIIAAGANSGNVAKLAHIGTGSHELSVPLPVVPRKRYVYVFHCPDGPGLKTPYLIDSTGVFFRREGQGGNYITGIAPTHEEEPSVDDLEVDYTFFEEKVWPLLCKRVPLCENIKLKSAWAGYYDFNELDENAILGRHPAYSNLYLATGFSGHGVMQAAATGRAVMELIVDGGFQTIDLTRFGFERLITKEPILEKHII